MFGKLIKHELRASGRSMLPILIAMPGLGILSNLALRLLDTGSGIVRFLSGAILFVFGVACLSLCLVALFVMIERWYRSVHSAEGYLTNTLPVSVHGIIWSRLISAAVYFILSVIVLILSLLLMDLSHELINAARDFFAAAIQLDVSDIDVRMRLLAAEMAATVIIFAIAKCLQFYAAISVGYAFNSSKELMSILAYVVLQIILVVAAVYIAQAVVHIPGVDLTSAAGILRFAACGCAGVALYGTACYFITVYAVKNRLNLE